MGFYILYGIKQDKTDKQVLDMLRRNLQKVQLYLVDESKLKTQLTWNNWVDKGSLICIDNSKKGIIFVATKDGPMAKALTNMKMNSDFQSLVRKAKSGSFRGDPNKKYTMLVEKELPETPITSSRRTVIANWMKQKPTSGETLVINLKTMRLKIYSGSKVVHGEAIPKDHRKQISTYYWGAVNLKDFPK